MAVTTANVNLRTGAGTGNSIITTIPADSEVVIGPVDVDGTLWYPVTFDGRQGWASGAYIDLAGTPVPAEPTPHEKYVADLMALTERMLGLWYHFGENFTQTPFEAKRGDCSGFVGWTAEQLGYRPGKDKLYNYSADQMFHNYQKGVWKAEKIARGQEQAGDIVFYGYKKSDGTIHVGHVVYAIGPGRVRGASGGFEATRTDADAKRVGAKVRDDDIGFHKNPIQGIYRPNYGA